MSGFFTLYFCYSCYLTKTIFFPFFKLATTLWVSLWDSFIHQTPKLLLCPLSNVNLFKDNLKQNKVAGDVSYVVNLRETYS